MPYLLFKNRYCLNDNFMNRFLLKMLFAICLFGNPMLVSGKVILPSLIADHMVLKQRSSVLLWGTALPNASVKIYTSWNKAIYLAKVGDNGKWNIQVKTPSAGGPYEITFNDGTLLRLTDILIGEVWVCSGQSNMDMPISGFKNQPILNANEILADAGNDQVRLFEVKRKLSKAPLDRLEGGWKTDDAENVQSFSAVGYQFAKMLCRKLKIPIGIIQSSWGGTNIIGWMGLESVKGFPELDQIARDSTIKVSAKKPASMYNAMIYPMLNYKISGVIWYQGEANRGEPDNYALLMKEMVAGWRKAWNIGEWSFYYVQLAPWAYTSHATLVPYLQEAQYKAMGLIPNSGMVVSIDVGSENTIHPPNKTVISERLAYWALGNTYGKKGVAYRSPTFKSVTYKNDTARLSFLYAENGFTSNGEVIRGFQIAGDDQVFYPAEAKISGTGINVVSEKVKNPVAVRYGFVDWIKGNVYNGYGLPLAPFRTDSWPPVL
jgi:sialate O-acetylesterase